MDNKENREFDFSLGNPLRTLGECNMVIKMKIVIILRSFLSDLSLFYATVFWTCVAPSGKRLCWCFSVACERRSTSVAGLTACRLLSS